MYHHYIDMGTYIRRVVLSFYFQLLSIARSKTINLRLSVKCESNINLPFYWIFTSNEESILYRAFDILKPLSFVSIAAGIFLLTITNAIRLMD